MAEVIFKRGEKEQLPQEASSDSLLFTIDTGQMYMGAGEGSDLIELTSLHVCANESELPGVGQKEKLYLVLEGPGLYVWDEGEEEYVSVGPEGEEEELGGEIPTGGSEGQVLVRQEEEYEAAWEDLEAESVSYDDSESGLGATSVQAAIEELYNQINS